MSQKLRVGVVGAGGIAQMMHLPTLAERPDLFEITAICDVKREVADAVAGRYHVGFSTTDVHALVARPDVDAVLLAASGSHTEAALAALKAGKHLFVEKPLGFGMEESEAIARVARESKGITVVGCHKRYDPVFRKARELVRAMRDLRYVQVTILHPDDGAYRTHHEVLPRPAFPPPTSGKALSAAEAEVAGERATVDHVLHGPLASAFAKIAGPGASTAKKVASLIAFQSLIHDTNVVRGVLGEPEAVLSATTWRGGFAQSSVTQFPNDVHCNMSWIAVGPLRNYEETVRFVGPDSRVTLVFPSPYLRHVPTDLLVERMEGGGLVVEKHLPTHEEAFRVELYEFREAALYGKAIETPIEDALGDARWLEALVAKMA